MSAVAAKTWSEVQIAIFALCLGFASLLALIVLAGENPLYVLGTLIGQGFFSVNGVADALVRAIPLCLAGLGVAISFRANVFNIGADGQIVIGAAFGMACAPLLAGVPGGLILLLVAGALGGALWGAIAGVLKARFGANEIIATIMLNYIAVQVISWLVRGPLQEPMGIFPRSDKLDNALRLPVLFDGTRISAGLLIAILACVVVWFIMSRSRFGYEVTVTGQNLDAARYGGVRPGWIAFAVLCLGGGLAGLAGMVEVAGLHGRLQEGFSSGMGITAIAVALLARLNPLWVPVSALGFAGLYVGSAAVARVTNVPFPLVHIIEASIILGFLLIRLLPLSRKG